MLGRLLILRTPFIFRKNYRKIKDIVEDIVDKMWKIL